MTARWFSASVVSEDTLVAFDPKCAALPLRPTSYHPGAVGGTGKRYVCNHMEPRLRVAYADKVSVACGIEFPGGEGHRTGIVRRHKRLTRERHTGLD